MTSKIETTDVAPADFHAAKVLVNSISALANRYVAEIGRRPNTLYIDAAKLYILNKTTLAYATHKEAPIAEIYGMKVVVRGVEGDRMAVSWELS